MKSHQGKLLYNACHQSVGLLLEKAHVAGSDIVTMTKWDGYHEQI